MNENQPTISRDVKKKALAKVKEARRNMPYTNQLVHDFRSEKKRLNIKNA